MPHQPCTGALRANSLRDVHQGPHRRGARPFQALYRWEELALPPVWPKPTWISQSGSIRRVQASRVKCTAQSRRRGRLGHTHVAHPEERVGPRCRSPLCHWSRVGVDGWLLQLDHMAEKRGRIGRSTTSVSKFLPSLNAKTPLWASSTAVGNLRGCRPV
jgi:hypothetical protein